MNKNSLTKLFHTDQREDMKGKKQWLKIELVIRKCWQIKYMYTEYQSITTQFWELGFRKQFALDQILNYMTVDHCP